MFKFKAKKYYKILGYDDKVDEKIKRRLLEFGFLVGDSFYVACSSPFGKCLIVELHGFSLAIRSEILAYVKVVGE